MYYGARQGGRHRDRQVGRNQSGSGTRRKEETLGEAERAEAAKVEERDWVGADREKEARETDGHPDPQRRQLKRAGVRDEGRACSPRAKQGQRRAVAHAPDGCGHLGCARCAWRTELVVLDSFSLNFSTTCDLWILCWGLQSREGKSSGVAGGERTPRAVPASGNTT